MDTNSEGDTIQLSTATNSVCDFGEATEASESPLPPPPPIIPPRVSDPPGRAVGASVTMRVHQKTPSM